MVNKVNIVGYLLNISMLAKRPLAFTQSTAVSQYTITESSMAVGP